MCASVSSCKYGIAKTGIRAKPPERGHFLQSEHILASSSLFLAAFINNFQSEGLSVEARREVRWRLGFGSGGTKEWNMNGGTNTQHQTDVHLFEAG